jgi:hypothetical protein
VNVADPIVSGIVPGLNQPGGNITGFAAYEVPLAGKWLELLSEIAPGLTRAALMFNPDRFSTLPAAAPVYMPSLETAARSLKVALSIVPVRSEVEKPSKGPSRRALKNPWPKKGVQPVTGMGIAGSVIRIEGWASRKFRQHPLPRGRSRIIET